MIKTANIPNIDPTDAKSYWSRHEALDQAKDEINADIAELTKEMRNAGHDPSAMKAAYRVDKERQKNPEKVKERSTMVDLWLAAVGKDV